MWVGMCTRWPASGTRSRSWSAARSARSGKGDISIVCTYMCSRPGWGRAPFEPAIAALEHRHRLGRVGALGRLAGAAGPRAARACGRSAPRRTARPRRGRRRTRRRPCAWRPRTRRSRVRSPRPACPSGKRARSAPISARSTGVPAPASSDGAGDGGVRGGHGVGQLLRLEGVPVLVVVGADRVGEAPVRHRAGGVGLDRALEAADGLLVVEGVAPGEAAVEPGLGVVRRGGDGTAEAAEVVVLVAEHGELPIIRCARG